jgi:NAD(P)-dependent dehydrogenase (short-subunit alcohol dehydrogenase family)
MSQLANVVSNLVQDKVAIVTGAGGGIGRAEAVALAEPHVGGGISADLDHRLDRVRRAQRAGQRRRDTGASDGERLDQAFTQGSGRAGMGAIELFGESLEVTLPDERIGMLR